MGANNIRAEGDSWFTIRWVAGSSKPLWRQADVVEEVFELASKLFVSFMSGVDVEADSLVRRVLGDRA